MNLTKREIELDIDQKVKVFRNSDGERMHDIVVIKESGVMLKQNENGFYEPVQDGVMYRKVEEGQAITDPSDWKIKRIIDGNAVDQFMVDNTTPHLELYGIRTQKYAIDHRHIAYGIYDHTVLMGIVTSEAEPSTGYAGVDVCVMDCFHGKGVGMALLEHIKEIVRVSYPCAYYVKAQIHEHNQASLRLFQKCGFKQIGYNERLWYLGEHQKGYIYAYDIK